MTRRQFEHAVRAAGAVLDTDRLLVIGSQAIHGTVSDALPPEAQRSIEVDIVALGDEDGRCADLIDGAIGEASMTSVTHCCVEERCSENFLRNAWGPFRISRTLTASS